MDYEDTIQEVGIWLDNIEYDYEDDENVVNYRFREFEDCLLIQVGDSEVEFPRIIDGILGDYYIGLNGKNEDGLNICESKIPIPEKVIENIAHEFFLKDVEAGKCRSMEWDVTNKKGEKFKISVEKVDENE